MQSRLIKGASPGPLLAQTRLQPGFRDLSQGHLETSQISLISWFEKAGCDLLALESREPNSQFLRCRYGHLENCKFLRSSK